MIRHILEFFEVLSYLYCFAAIYGKKVKFNIYAVVFMVSELVLMTGLNEYGFPKYLVSLSYVLMILYCMLNYKSTLKETIVKCAISIVLISIVQILGYFILTSIFRRDDRNSLLWELIIMITCFLFAWLIAPRTKINKATDFLMRKNKLLGIIGGFALLALGSQIWFMVKNGYVNGREYILFVYFVLIFVVLLTEWQRTRMDSERKKMQLEMNAMYYSAYEDLIRSVREKQHDFKNHINAIHGMLYSINDYGKLVECENEYLKNILDETEETSILTLVENPLIAGFLSEKIHEAEKNNIQVIYDCVLPNEKLPLPEYKLVEMMGILFDNAIEATKEKQNRIIQINLYKDRKHLVFETINECENENIVNAEKMFEVGYSSKGQNRGIGLSKLKNMIAGQNGEIIVGKEDLQEHIAIKFSILIPC